MPDLTTGVWSLDPMGKSMINGENEEKSPMKSMALVAAVDDPARRDRAAGWRRGGGGSLTVVAWTNYRERNVFKGTAAV